MMSFSFFFSARWNNYRRLRPDRREARLLALHEVTDPTGSGTADSYDPTSTNDLSYEDAILGLQIRSFMQTEYGSAEPPPGVFRRILKAIEQGLAPSYYHPADTWAFCMRLLVNGRVAGRLVPGMVAFALVLMVFGTNATRFLSPGSVALSIEGPAISSPPLAQQTINPVATEPTSEALKIEGLDLPIRNETQFYDRVELKLPALHHPSKTDQPDDQQQDTPYERNRNGAQ